VVRERPGDEGLGVQLIANGPIRRSKVGLSLLALLGALVVLILAPTVARSAQLVTPWRGVQVHSLWATESNQQMQEDLDYAKRAGVNVVRLDIGWATLNSTAPGKLTAWYSQKLAAFMAYANRLNIKVIGILFTTPCWASSAPASLKQNCQGDWWGRGVGWYPPTNDQDFASFVRYITSTYGSELAAVEIWNEPDNANANYWVSPNPAADYAQLLKAAYPAAKAGDSSLPVLAAAMAGSDLPFLGQLYQDGIQGYYDGISVHPYCGGNAPAATPAGSDVRYEFQAGLEALHALQLQHGDSTPIWVTEFGWSNVYNYPQDQAAYIKQGYQILAGMPYVKSGIVYELHDDIGGSVTDPEANYGLLNQDYTTKPAYAAFTSVMTAPAAPVLTQPAGGLVVNNPRPALSFTATPASTVAVSIDGTSAGTATADAAGNATLTMPSPLVDGQHSVVAIDTDPYGNVGPASASAMFTVTPAPPTIVSPQAGTTDQHSLTVEVGGAPNDTATVSVDGAVVGTVSADAGGAATLTVPAPLADGQHTVSATATDQAGNVSPASPVVQFVVGPPPPVILSPHSGTTSDVSLTVQVQGVPGDTASVCIDISRCSTTTITARGDVTLSVTKLSPGAHSVRARQSDGLGLASSWGAQRSWTVKRPAGSPVAVLATVASAPVRDRLQLRLGGLRRGVLPVTCVATHGTIERCQVVVFANGRRLGSGKISFRRSGHGTGVIRLRLTGARYRRIAKRRPMLTLRATATMSAGHAVKVVRRVRLS
jgi:hypothetical protein